MATTVGYIDFDFFFDDDDEAVRVDVLDTEEVDVLVMDSVS